MSVKSFLKRYLTLGQKAYFMALRNGYKRSGYLRRHNILREIGEDVYYYSRIYPSDPKLLKIHDHVVIATNVRFLGHDRMDLMLSGMYGQKYKKQYGCIEVMDNVFIGADCIILPGVKIGENTVIGAGAVVTRDLEPGFVWGGIPARKIGTFDGLIARRKDVLAPESDPDRLWELFDQRHSEPLDI